MAHVDCVVGIGGSIRDDAARSFAIGFYGGLGERESVAAAFRQGCAAISLEGLREADRPRLQVRDGIDADGLVLAAMDPPRVPKPESRAAEAIDALQMQVAEACALIAEMSTHSQGIERHDVDISWGEERLSRWKARVIKYLDANLSHAEARRFSMLSSTLNGGCPIEHFESSARAHLSYLDALVHELRGKTIEVNPQERPSGKDLPVHPTFTYRKSR